MDNDILEKISVEIKRQNDKWGVQNHGWFYWLSILVEEVGEVGKAICEGNQESYKEELIHVIAVSVQMLMSYKRVGV